MKKNEYVAPEMEIVEITEPIMLPEASNGSGIPVDPDPEEDPDF